jgi:uncharacterized protein (TIGR02757 family)
VFEGIYSKYNKKEFLSPDPLEFIFKYKSLEDREICGLVASSLAYGRVAQIISSVGIAMPLMGKSPRDFVENAAPSVLRKVFRNFKHRFTDGGQMASLLENAKIAIGKYSGLGGALLIFFEESNRNYAGALEKFSCLLNGGSERANYLIPRPSSGSACKRLNLFIKWFVRRDEIDPGGWTGMPSSQLIIPLDTHMWQISAHLGFTSRRQADFKAALEISGAFKKINPSDPCKYDFALTRLGIRNTAAKNDCHTNLSFAVQSAEFKPENCFCKSVSGC